MGHAYYIFFASDRHALWSFLSGLSENRNWTVAATCCFDNEGCCSDFLNCKRCRNTFVDIYRYSLKFLRRGTETKVVHVLTQSALTKEKIIEMFIVPLIGSGTNGAQSTAWSKQIVIPGLSYTMALRVRLKRKLIHEELTVPSRCFYLGI